MKKVMTVRPIKLKIKGLNSFIEEQIIDFEKLGSRGLFGIFGPTGSGKSTVLDGITLALYGNVARKSSNFINTNCDRMNVSFEFQVSSSEVKRYLVDREFKRTNNAIRAGKCKIVDITNPEEKEVLADGVKTLNKKIEEIIGLNLEDFTRTVVLPQGKFSEFLKLEGKERREMLERLFNLQKYGDELSQRLFTKIAQEKSENSVLCGQLKGYEDISEDTLKDRINTADSIEKKLKDLNDEMKKLNDKFNESEELWNYQNELSKYKDEEKRLEGKKGYIDAKKEKMNLGEAANRVMPYINAYEDTLNKHNQNKLQLEMLKEKLEELNTSREEIEKKWISAKEDKENRLPKLMIDEQKALKAIEEAELLKQIENNIEILNNSLIKLKKKFDFDSENLSKVNAAMGSKRVELQNFEEEYDSLKIDEEFKQKVQNGLINEENKMRVNELMKKREAHKASLEKEIEDIIRDGKGLSSSLKEIDTKIKEKETQLEDLIKSCPGEQKDLIVLNQRAIQNEQKWTSYEKLNKEIEKSKEEFKKLNSEIEKSQQLLKQKKINLDEIKEIHKNAVKEELAYKLREELKDGEACPVCGSIHHVKENIHEAPKTDLEEINAKIKQAEEEVSNINMQIARYQANCANINDKISINQEEIKKLGDEFKAKTVSELKSEAEKLEKSINEYTEKKDALEKEINDLKIKQKEQDGEIKALRAKLRAAQGQVDSLVKEINDNKDEISKIEDELKKLKEETDVDNFREKNESIKNTELRREKLSKSIKEFREFIKGLEEKRDKLTAEINEIKEQTVKCTSDLEGLEKNKNEKIESIRKNTGEEKDIYGLLNKIQSDIKNINESLKVLEEKKNYIEDEFLKCRENVKSSQDNNEALNSRLKSDKERLDKSLEEERFRSTEHVKENVIEKSVIDNYRREVDLFREAISKTQALIESLVNKINGRSISEEQYKEIKVSKENKEIEIKDATEEKIKVTEEVKSIKEKLEKQKELLGAKKELEHKLSLLSDLEKLFKGKKFVEFVASYQLKYVSIEASKRLKEITHGSFGLEVDENGRFIIRDYKNGGAARDASTLSGGETFLASLSLALALSAQIQLKGTAPLELFFLDEGFGTLDDDLLEVVMNSLEQIHNDKLKVGIISHVESIKNRVPVKLIVSPAESGRGGSKVKIEMS